MTLCIWLDSDPDPYNLIGSGSDQKVLSGSGSATLPTVPLNQCYLQCPGKSLDHPVRRSGLLSAVKRSQPNALVTG